MLIAGAAQTAGRIRVFGASLPAVTMGELEKMRGGVLEVMTWAFGVVLGDDGEWLEPRAQDETKSDALKAAKRLAWFGAILRISFAARRGFFAQSQRRQLKSTNTNTTTLIISWPEGKTGFVRKIGISGFPGGSYPKYKKPTFSASTFPPDS